MKTGLNNSKAGEFKNLQPGTILLSAEFRSPENEVVAVPYIFKEYVKAPDMADPSAIWARLIEATFDENNVVQPIKRRNRDGVLVEKSIVNDISVGLYTDIKDCLTEFVDMFDEMRQAAMKTLESVMKNNPYENLTIGEGIETDTEFKTNVAEEAIAEVAAAKGENA